MSDVAHEPLVEICFLMFFTSTYMQLTKTQKLNQKPPTKNTHQHRVIEEVRPVCARIKEPTDRGPIEQGMEVLV